MRNKSLDVHLERHHRDRYQQLRGKPPKPMTPCPHCLKEYAEASQLTDHMLKTHGIIPDNFRKDEKKLARAKPEHLSYYLEEQTQQLEQLCQRLVAAEGRLSQLSGGDYFAPGVGHGLEPMTQRPTNPLADAGADQALAAVRREMPNRAPGEYKSVLLARRVCQVQQQMDQQGQMPDGKQASFVDIVQELEIRVALLVGK